MSQLEAFRDAVETFLSQAGMNATQFGKEALNDPNFVHDLRTGRSPSLATVDRVSDFMRERTTEERAA